MGLRLRSKLQLFFYWAQWLSFWAQVTQFRIDQKNIKTNILSMIHDDYFNKVTSSVLIRFSFYMAQWPSFWPQVNQFRINLKNIRTNILSMIHDDYFKNVTSGVLTRFSFDLV